MSGENLEAIGIAVSDAVESMSDQPSAPVGAMLPKLEGLRDVIKLLRQLLSGGLDLAGYGKLHAANGTAITLKAEGDTVHIGFAPHVQLTAQIWGIGKKGGVERISVNDTKAVCVINGLPDITLDVVS